MPTASNTAQSPHSGQALQLICCGFAHAPSELAAGLREIEHAFPQRFTTEQEGWQFTFNKQAGQRPGFAVEVDAQNITITYSTPAAAFRAFGIVMGKLQAGTPPESFKETSAFSSIGAMLDVSRNGVLKLESVRGFIRHFALMGLNQLMLYTEDTFEIPDEPLFGYGRGGYSQDDLRTIDQYAAHFGIEVIPCIQTLGHLAQVLQWPHFQALRDTDSVLLVGDERVTAFVEKMITAVSAPFRSKRIHIGMDEAHGIGSGIYRLKNGLRAPFEILCEHLQQTVETCERHGLKPMIWSDMFFRLSSKTNNYYDTQSRIDPSLAQSIPPQAQLVYWDYYHTDTDFYDEWISRHRQLGQQPIFAAGIWTWNRFWAQLPHSIHAIHAGMAAAVRQELDEVLVTMWGDDGMECDPFSALPAVQMFADMAYGQAAPDETSLSENFLGSVDHDLQSWMCGSGLDLIPVEAETDYEANASKWIFWQDPLLGHLEAQILPEFLDHFRNVTEQLAEATLQHPRDERLQFMQKMAEALAWKTELHLTLRSAYQRGDSSTLSRISRDVLIPLVERVAHLQELHEKAWHRTFRYHGWDVIEKRYVTLHARLQKLRVKLELYLDDKLDSIEELNARPLQLWPHEHTQSITLVHRQASTPTIIA